VSTSPGVAEIKDHLEIHSGAGRARGSLVVWIVLIALIVVQGSWALYAGWNLRRDLWPNTRTVRFQADELTLFYLGNGALRSAEDQAHLTPLADLQAGQPDNVIQQIRQNGGGSGKVRKLTFLEICDGVVHFYDVALNGGEGPFGDPYMELDYPPLRLGIAALFVHHVQQTHPDLQSYPVRRNRFDTVVPQIEDIMQPMVTFNTICELAAAVAMFPLVWIWMRRGAGKRLLDPLPRYPSGLVTFVLATGVFWYFYAGLSALPARPLPVVDLISANPSGYLASVWGTVDGQQSIARWRLEWGDSPAYSHATTFRPIPGIRQIRVLEAIGPLKPGETVHFRLIASNLSGTSATEDHTFVAWGPVANFASSPAGGTSWPGWGAWMGMLALFIVMVASARGLPPRLAAVACAWVAAMMVWFDPITILNSNVWPQWDVWILPIYILAVLLASVNWWFSAGVLLGFGCMLKGQILLGGPILFLWPLFEGKWREALRIIIGFGVGTSMILWPWLLNSSGARTVFFAFMLSVVLYGDAVLVFRKILTMRETHGHRYRRTLYLVIFFALCCLTWMLLVGGHWLVALALLLLSLPIPWFIRSGTIKYWTAATGVAALWLMAACLNGDFAWWKLGFAYGTVKHDQMQMGRGSFASLPAILAQKYGWDLHQTVGNLAIGFGKFNWSQDLDLKTSLAILYGITLLFMSFAAAMHSRRKDPRILIALCAPWLLFPIIMCQTSERYLLWPSAFSAALIAVSTGFSLLHVLLALAAAGMIGHQLLMYDHTRWPAVFQFWGQLYPEIGFMLILLAAIFFFAALVPGKTEE
jgi:hypothetical protein